MPQPPSRAVSSKELPPSVESAYYRKCIDLRRRINDIEDSNDGTRQRITRLNRGIQKMRLERAFLLEQLNKHMEYNVDDSDRSSSPPPTPTDKPLRSKRSHNRKGTPPAGGERIESGMQEQRISGLGGAHMAHGMNPMSSAQSTPDPSSRPQQTSYFGTTAASPHNNAAAAVNGAPPPTLPPLHTLPQLQPQQATTGRAYFDPAYDNERPTPASNEDEAGRRRAYSGAGAQQPAPAPASNAEAAPQNGDTEMTDAGFTAVNR